MPMLNEHVTQMDDARMQFLDTLARYVNYLREELRVNELILQSVARSISVKTDEVNRLDTELQQRRDELAMHRPEVRPSVNAPAAREHDAFDDISKLRAAARSNVDERE